MEHTESMGEAAPAPPALLKVPTTLKALIEGLIFAAQEPLSIREIRAIYEGDPRAGETRALDPEEVRTIIVGLNADYVAAGRPYRIVQIAGGYQFATLPEYAEWLGKLHREQGRRRLSQSGIETLAIVAYKQPITKAEIEKIRGVNCDYVLKALLEKELLTITGRAETVGRPLLYGTTREFLKHFGLNDVTDLPRPREIEEILGESEFETERRMLEAQAGADAMKKETEEFKSRLPHIPKKKPELTRPVEIVPHKRTRTIKVVHAAPAKDLEEAGQERMEFPPVPPRPSEEEALALEEAARAEAPLPGEQIAAAEPSVGTPVEHPQTAEEQPHTRWSTWKQKVQSFIRKLFG